MRGAGICVRQPRHSPTHGPVFSSAVVPSGIWLSMQWFVHFRELAGMSTLVSRTPGGPEMMAEAHLVTSSWVLAQDTLTKSCTSTVENPRFCFSQSDGIP